MVSLYASFVYGILYASLGALPYEFSQKRGWSKLVGSLPFLAELVGCAIGAGVNISNQRFYLRKFEANDHRPVPEARLPPMMSGSLFLVSGLFIFAWTAQADAHWLAPVIGVILLGERQVHHERGSLDRG